MTALKRFFPIGIFLLFSAVILGAVLILKPGWGFMDDFTNRYLAVSFWNSPAKFDFLKDIVHTDIRAGRFRPGYFSSVLLFYGLFQSHPLLFNLALTTVGLLFLPVWGKVIQMAFEDNDPRVRWVYVLSFFIFTPFWNLFMYLSLQERFYLFLAALGLLSYLSAKKEGSAGKAVLASACFVVLVLCKETAIAVLAAVCFYALVDLLWLEKERRANRAFLVTSAVFAIPYIVFLKTVVLGGFYSKKYGVVGSVPLVCQAMLLLAFAAILFYAVQRFFLKRYRPVTSSWLVFPLCLMAYISVLIPWGFPTYMLSPVPLFLFPTLYLVVYFLRPRQKTLFYAAQISLALFVVALSVVPAIGVMADKRKVTDHLRDHFAGTGATLFFPPPYIESSESLAALSGAHVVYVSSGILNTQLNYEKQNYMITHLDCGAVRMDGSRVDAEIYRNNTWSIKTIVPDAGGSTVVRPAFGVNFLTTLKRKIRGL